MKIDKDLFKNSIKTIGILLLIPLFLIARDFIGPQELIKSEDSLFFILSFTPLSFIIFYFLFKYQRDEYRNKSMFWKLPLGAAILGALVMLIPTILLSISCSGEGCWGAGLFIFFGMPLAVIIPAIITFVLTLNAWYKTNLYIVEWTIVAWIFFYSTIFPFIFVFVPQSSEIKLFFIPIYILCGFLIGTVLALVIKILRRN